MFCRASPAIPKLFDRFSINDPKHLMSQQSREEWSRLDQRNSEVYLSTASTPRSSALTGTSSFPAIAAFNRGFFSSSSFRFVASPGNERRFGECIS